jgi:hypothetical protein
MNMKTPKTERGFAWCSIGTRGDIVIDTGNYSAGVLNQYVEQQGQPTKGLLHSAAHRQSNDFVDGARQRLVGKSI